MSDETGPFEAYTPWIALGWSVDAMTFTTDRVNMVPATDPSRAFAAIGEAVWWITVVNDTLVRRHPDAYKLAAESCTPHPAPFVAGLRSVRHRIGHEVDLVDFIEPVAEQQNPGDGRVTAWVWRSTPPPTRKDRRDIEGHRAYEDAVAGQNIVYVFTLVTGFLQMAHANAQNGLPTIM